jgi:hypothetical protein
MALCERCRYVWRQIVERLLARMQWEQRLLVRWGHDPRNFLDFI